MTLLTDEIMKHWHVLVHWYNTATEQPQFSATNWSQCHFAHCRCSDLDKNPVGARAWVRPLIAVEMWWVWFCRA